ncbi:MAG: FHA domain-containing protein [Myxococcales bacterium]|nr:FHA domain-containing protein [Myxococcales bacterium]
MAVRLRYLGHNLVVPEGEFVIGRSSKCQLSVDDPLISRRHAVLIVTGDTAVLQDLGSRNGVSVNSKRVEGFHQLADGDTITVGSQNMVIQGLAEGTPAHGGRVARRDLETQTISGFELSDDTAAEATVIHGTPFVPGSPDKRVHELSLIGAVAEKALAMGRPEDAQRLLERPLRELLVRARGTTESSSRFDPTAEEAAAQRAALLATRLAGALGKGEWIEYVLDLFLARRELLPQPAVDELYTVLRKVRIDARRLKTYLDTLRPDVAGQGPNERFLFSRIEGLEPLVGLK